jgi:hypothetical protein
MWRRRIDQPDPTTRWCDAVGGRLIHGDVIDRSKLHRLYLAPPSPRGLLLYARAQLFKGGPIDAESIAAECPYRSHLVLRRSS